jgi:diguanylate cyclase (GGDEF)-like protein
MRLFAQILAIICAVVLLSFGTALLVRDIVVEPVLTQIQMRADRQDLRRVLLAIEGWQQQLTALSYENAMRQPMYDFVQQRDDAFLDDNFPIEIFYTLNIDDLAVFDLAGNLIAQRSADMGSLSFVERPLPIAALRAVLPNLSRANPSAPVFRSGLIAADNAPLLYAATSILCSHGDCYSNGSLVLTRRLDRDFFADISETTQLHVHARAPRSDAGTDLMAVRRNSDDQLLWLLRDDGGAPLLELVVQLPPSDIEERLASVPLLVAFFTSMVGYVIVLWLVQRLLINPIRRFDQVMRQVRQQGDYGLRINSALKNELGDLGRHIDEVLAHVESQRKQLEEQARHMRSLSYEDSLTGLANRRRFDQAIADNWALSQRARKPLALIMFDVDFFKPFNDNYGHQRGDEVLKMLGEIVRGVVVRQSDVAARYGGEEFAVLLPDTSEESAVRLAEALRAAVNAAAIVHEHSPIGRSLTCSFGVASMVPTVQHGPRELVHRADTALYASKTRGRDCVTAASELD